ncbi:MAG: Ldh family oxidoreductase [Acidobacteriota bacterium]
MPVRLYPAEKLRAFAEQALARCKVPESDAAVVADNLVEANLRGVDSHGVTSLLGIYVKRLKKGLINPRPSFSVVSESPSTLVLDADNGLGALIGKRAMQECLRRASESGAAWAGVRHSNHFGAAAYFSLMAARSGRIGIAMTNGPPNMPPWGGSRPYLSTNPISIALPAEGEPVVLDMATSVVARFQIIRAATRGDTALPEGWALDERGRPTTDPKEALEGFAMPMGGHKGYGLSLMIDALCGVLAGGAFGPDVGSLQRRFDRPQDVGHMFAAIDVARMIPLPEFSSRLARMCSELHQIEPAQGFERVYVPGEIEAEQRRRRLKEGIPVDETAWQRLREVAQELKISLE